MKRLDEMERDYYAYRAEVPLRSVIWGGLVAVVSVLFLLAAAGTIIYGVALLFR